MSDRNARNEKVLLSAFRQFDKQREDYIIKSLEDAARELLRKVVQTRTFLGFTGNTQTSYACGVYKEGRLVSILEQENWNAPIKRLKVRRGERVFLNDPYEGASRAVTGKVDVNNLSGLQTSRAFLKGFSCGKKGFGLVMTTGTEYSEFLEQRLDVLTGISDKAYDIILSNFKPMQEKQGGLFAFLRSL